MDRQPLIPFASKGVFVRLVLLGAVLAWAIWKMGAEEDRAAAMAVHPLPPPDGRAAPAGDPPPVVDPEALARALDAARRAAAACEAGPGTLTVRLGPPGLLDATFTGPLEDARSACLAAAVWSQPWPRGAQELTTELAW